MTHTALLHVWGIRRRHIPRALWFMASDRFRLRRVVGLQFAKSLGTGSGQTFTLRDADSTHWALLTVWQSAEHATAFANSAVLKNWRHISTEVLRVEMRPLFSRGEWAGMKPLQPTTVDHDHSPDSPQVIAAITRARIKLKFWRRFAVSVPAVSKDLSADAGLLFALGIGEAPIGLQGTFSLWASHESITAFAYKRQAHTAVISKTKELNWYAEEMFARLRVESIHGTYNGQPVMTPEWPS